MGMVELGVALLVTAGLIVLQATMMLHAGPLWRDEISTLRVVESPTLWEMLKMNCGDSFPSLFHVLLRGWMALGLGDSDAMLRVLPFLIGLGLIGAIWWTGRRLGCRVPLITLVLFGLSPTVLRFAWGVRAYILGVLLMFVVMGLLWELIQKPTRGRILLTALVAVLAVQAVYVNAFMLLASCAGAAAVCLRRRQWKTLGIILGIGVAAAISVLPYVPMFQRSSEWTALVKVPINTPWLLLKFADAAECALPYGEAMLWIWLAVGLVGLVTCGYRANPSATDQPPERKDLALYALASLVAGSVCFFVYLQFLSVATQVWYYIPVMGVVAVLADVGVALFVSGGLAGRLVRLGFVIALIAMTWSGAWASAHMRWTNCDLVAGRVRSLAEKDDYIVVSPHYVGAAFARYYTGSAPWTTLPELDQYRFQSYVSFKQKMMQPEAIKPILERMAKTLQSGHRVWLVSMGGMPLLRPGEEPGDLAPAPNSPAGWSEGAYVQIWLRQTAYVIQSHATRLSQVPVPVADPVFPHEDLMLLCAEGWH